MEAKDKAKALVKKFYVDAVVDFNAAKLCALIAVDEILKVTAPIIDSFEPYYQELSDEMTQNYWQQVKQEIENL